MEECTGDWINRMLGFVSHMHVITTSDLGSRAKKGMPVRTSGNTTVFLRLSHVVAFIEIRSCTEYDGY